MNMILWLPVHSLCADYMYHTLAAKASGELCLKYLFAFGGFARSPLVQRFASWKCFTWDTYLIKLRIKILHMNHTYLWSQLNALLFIFKFCISAADWKVPTSFIYGKEDWMDYRGAQDACSKMTVPRDIVRIEKVLLVLFILSSCS